MQATVTNATMSPEKLINGEVYEKVRRLATSSAVVLFSTTDCCMCHVAKRLLFGLGVAPTIIELDRLGDIDNIESPAAGDDVRAVLSSLYSSGGRQLQPLPAVFVGGTLLGGIESLMAYHINGSLVPLLKEAGALWL